MQPNARVPTVPRSDTLHVVAHLRVAVQRLATLYTVRHLAHVARYLSAVLRETIEAHCLPG